MINYGDAVSSMAEDTWAKALHAVYQATGELERDELAEAADIDTEEVRPALAFLERHSLIEEGETLTLTEKGFDVARKREMELSQFETNLYLAAFTFVLSLAIVLQTAYQIQGLGLPGKVAGYGLLAATLLFFILLERRTRLVRLLLEGR